MYVVIQIRTDNTWYLTGYDKEKNVQAWVTNSRSMDLLTVGLYTKRDANLLAKKVNGLAVSIKDITRMRERKG